MKYFFVEPEVAGGVGANTVMNRDVHPPIVRRNGKHRAYSFGGDGSQGDLRCLCRWRVRLLLASSTFSLFA
jgi:hypothetical protein